MEHHVERSNQGTVTMETTMETTSHVVKETVAKETQRKSDVKEISAKEAVKHTSEVQSTKTTHTVKQSQSQSKTEQTTSVVQKVQQDVPKLEDRALTKEKSSDVPLTTHKGDKGRLDLSREPLYPKKTPGKGHGLRLSISAEHSLADYSTSSSSEPGSSSSSMMFSKDNVMEVYKEREKLFNQHMLAIPKETHDSRKQLSRSLPRTVPVSPVRTKSLSPARQIVGLDHLDNLLRLMEQLSQLREENGSLKKRCAYLEDTKSLLMARSEIYQRVTPIKSPAVHAGKTRSSRLKSRIATTRSEIMSAVKPESSLKSRARSEAAEDRVREKHEPEVLPPKLAKTQRSQSVGSIDLEELFNDTAENFPKRAKSADKSKSNEYHKQLEHKKAKSRISSKWERVKKVFSGKQEHLDGSPEQVAPVPAPKQHSVAQAKESIHRTDVIHRSEVRMEIADMKHVDNKNKDDKEPSVVTSSDGLKVISELSAEPITPFSAISDPVLSPSSCATEEEVLYEEIGPRSLERSKSMTSITSSESSASSALSDSATCDVNKEVEVTMQKLVSPVKPPPEHRSLRRRQSSPTLSMSGDLVTDTLGVGGASPSPRLSRSSSFKVLKTPVGEDSSPSPSPGSKTPDRVDSKKGMRTAWGRVKDIIHTRRDSLKKRTPKKSSERLDGESRSITGDHTDGEYDSLPGSNRMSADMSELTPTTPKSASPKATRKFFGSPPQSPKVPRKKADSDSPQMARKEKGDISPSMLVNPAVDVGVLMEGMSDDFTRKMQAWEDKQRKRQSKESFLDSLGDASLSGDFLKKLEEWERKKARGGSPPAKHRGSKDDSVLSVSSSSSEFASPPPVTLGAAPVSGGGKVEELAKGLTDSFQQKLKEWELQKSNKAKEPSPQPVPVDQKCSATKVRKDDKAKKREKTQKRGDKEMQRIEKQREKDIQKLLKEQAKLEKERQRLEKLRGKLDLAMDDPGPKAKPRGGNRLSMFGDMEVSGDFAKKLHEWEVKKGLRKPEAEPAPPVGGATESHSTGHELVAEPPVPMRSESPMNIGQYQDNKPSPLHLMPYTGTPEKTSPVDMTCALADVSGLSSQTIEDESNTTLASTTSYTSQSSEEERQKLLNQLRQKEEDYLGLQDRLHKLNNNLTHVQKQHRKQLEIYKKEVWLVSQGGHMAQENDLVSSLRQRIKVLQMYGDQLAREKRDTESRALSQALEHNTLETRLLEEIKQLKLAMDSAAVWTEETGHTLPSQEEAQEEFEHVYNYIVLLQTKLSDLKLGVVERNQVINEMRRHLLVQEVTNLLLQADIRRRELQLRFFRQRKRNIHEKRWKTYGGVELWTREEGDGCADPSPAKTDCEISTFQERCRGIDTLMEQVQHGDVEFAIPDAEWVSRLRVKEHAKKRDLQTEAIQTEAPLAEDIAVQTLSEVPDLRAVETQTAAELPVPTDNIGVQTQALPSPVQARRAKLQREKVISVDSRSRPVPGCISESSTPPPSPDARCHNRTEFVIDYKDVIAASKSSSSVRKRINSTDSKSSTSSVESLTEMPIVTAKVSVEPAIPVNNIAEIKEEPANGDDVVTFTVRLTTSPPVSSNTTVTDARPSTTISETRIRTRASRQQEVNSMTSSDDERMTLDPYRLRKDNKLPDVVTEESDRSKKKYSDNIARKPELPSQLDHRGKSSERSEYLYVVARGGLPHSPIIKSRSPRRLKGHADNSNSQMYADVRTWQATPPRRYFRHMHKKISSSSEKISEIPSPSMSPTDKIAPKTRARAATWESTSTADDGDTEDTPCSSPRKKSNHMPVLDLVSRFEKKPDVESVPNLRFKRSPSPPVHVSTMRKLKSAAELLQDSEQHHQRSAPGPSGATEGPNEGPMATVEEIVISKAEPEMEQAPQTSSDKENDKAEKKRLHRLVPQMSSSRESSPLSVYLTPRGGESPQLPRHVLQASAAQSELVQQVVQRLGSPDSPGQNRTKPPLTDMTNDGRVQKLKDAFGSGSIRNSPEKNNGASAALKKKPYDSPKDGTVLKQKEAFQNRIDRSESPLSSKSSSRRSSASNIEAAKLIVKPDSTITLDGEKPSTSAPEGKSVYKVQKDNAASMDTDQAVHVEASVVEITAAPMPSPSTHTSPSSRAQDKRTPLFKRLSKDSLVVKKEKHKPAVSALCRHTINVDIDSQSPSNKEAEDASAEGGEEDKPTKKHKGKFLDSSWFQKPKRLFRVSKWKLHW